MKRIWGVAIVSLLAIVACQLGRAPSPTIAPSPTAEPPTSPPQPSATARPTTTPPPRATSTPSGPLCLDGGSVSVDDVGKTIVVCGRVVDEGEVDCPSCAYGVYSYLTFKGGFNVISYYWNFISYENACLVASDKVEQIGANPVFVYGASEGFAGSECTRAADGSLTCEQGDYFQSYDGCD